MSANYGENFERFYSRVLRSLTRIFRERFFFELSFADNAKF